MTRSLWTQQPEKDGLVELSSSTGVLEKNQHLNDVIPIAKWIDWNLPTTTSTRISGYLEGPHPTTQHSYSSVFWSLVQPVSDFQPALNDVKFPSPKWKKLSRPPPLPKKSELKEIFALGKHVGLYEMMKWCSSVVNLPPFVPQKIQGFLISISANNSWVPTLEFSRSFLFWIWRTQTNQMQWWDMTL